MAAHVHINSQSAAVFSYDQPLDGASTRHHRDCSLYGSTLFYLSAGCTRSECAYQASSTPALPRDYMMCTPPSHSGCPPLAVASEKFTGNVEKIQDRGNVRSGHWPGIIQPLACRTT
jgi:hypothetical protein